MITYSDLVKKTMPPEKRKTANKCIVGHYLVRPISNIISIPLIEMNVDPTLITIISGVFPIIAFIAFAFFDGGKAFLTGWFCILIWNVLDGVDGNIARYNDKCSQYGELWDATVGWIATITFYVGMGFTAYRNPGIVVGDYPIPNSFYLIMGWGAAMAWILPRLVMQKKIVLLGKESVRLVKDRENYGILKLVFFNFTSINGLAAMVYLGAFFTNLNGLCMIGYFFVSMAVMIGSLWSLLKSKGE